MRKSKPPSESAFCVDSVAPVGVRSDICAFGARPVTYTCSALPTAVNGGGGGPPGVQATAVRARSTAAPVAMMVRPALPVRIPRTPR